MLWLRVCTVVLAFSVLFVSPVRGHHLWVVEDEDGYVVARGKASERLDAYNPRCVKDFVAFSSDGMRIPSEKIRRVDAPEQVRFRTSQKASLVGVSCDWGYRVNTTKGKKFLTRSEAEKAGLRVINSFFSTQYAKVLFNEGARTTEAIGMRFELVPLENPLQIAEGEDLPLQVLFNQKPLPETPVFTKDGHEFRADGEGVCRVKVGKQGLQLFMAKHKVPVEDDPKKDYHIYRTFLVFEGE